MIRLYRFDLSGHSHRAQLMLSLLGLPFEMHDIDLTRGEQRTSGFLAKNPFGQVPVLEEDGVTLADSNAILVYLARRHDPQGRWLPEEAVAAAQVQRWLSVAAGPLAEGPGRARVDVLFRRPRDAQAHATARRLFGWMEARLAAQPFLAASGPTIADVALYTYTAHAPEGGVMLEPYPEIGAWLGRVEALPGFVGMRRLPAAPPLAG